MKRIIVSAGLVTVSAVGLQAATAPGLTRMQAAKWWTVSAALRGFYDDNYYTLPADQDRGSYGIQITPYVAANFPREQTYFGLSYQYDARWYEDRKKHEWDQSHQVVAKLEHRFSPRYNLEFEDVFTYSDEPELLEPGATITVPVRLRTESSAFRNRPSIAFRAALTEMLGAEVGFINQWYDYKQEQDDARDPVFNPLGLQSRSALLDRWEYYPRIDLRYQVRESLVGLVGYQFGYVDYTSDEPIGLNIVTGQLIPGSIRNSQSHSLYVGGEYNLSAQMTASGRVGAEYTTFEDLDSGEGWTPYIDANLAYQYLPGSTLQGGVRYSRNPTDVSFAGFDVTDVDRELTTDQETVTFYAQVNHRITPRLTGSAIGTVQYSTFKGGSQSFDGSADWLFLMGLNLNYKFTENWSAEAGYNFDRLDSDISYRSFSRNRVYVGARATY